ncbi:hypothetical protein EVAR_15797_1 [Eumeta japonica]|uniref:Uncharacterized protein n=1 Tax=Eumeta variegata TaxID=151549 RepID=A0A4C1TZH0_EUMVA|nr:hypothetical protein EVAR_15797_1 [Eumeta japonica]
MRHCDVLSVRHRLPTDPKLRRVCFSARVRARCRLVIITLATRIRPHKFLSVSKSLPVILWPLADDQLTANGERIDDLRRYSDSNWRIRKFGRVSRVFPVKSSRFTLTFTKNGDGSVEGCLTLNLKAEVRALVVTAGSNDNDDDRSSPCPGPTTPWLTVK